MFGKLKRLRIGRRKTITFLMDCDGLICVTNVEVTATEKPATMNNFGEKFNFTFLLVSSILQLKNWRKHFKGDHSLRVISNSFFEVQDFFSAWPMVSLQVWQDKDPKQPFYNQQLPLPSPAGKYLHLCLSIFLLLIGFVSLCLLKTIRESSNSSPSSLCWGWTLVKGQTISSHPLSHTTFL